MLVLSRRVNQQVVFPNLGIKVHVLRSRRGVVRLGIEAPREIAVYRDEVAAARADCPSGTAELPADATIQSGLLSRQARHDLRNRLNTAFLGLHLLHRKLQLGELEEAEDAIARVFRELESLDQQFTAGNTITDDSHRPVLSRRILLVDDDPNESELLAGYLETYDYEVVRAYDGEQAIAYLGAHEKPDFVLLDMQMPKLNGAETIKRIRQDPALDGIRVYAVSGLDSQTAGVTIGPTGVDRWFTKPLSPRILMEALQRELAAR